MERFPVVITIGAALIGWVAGEMAWDESVFSSFTSQFPKWYEYIAAAIGAGLVILLGNLLARKTSAATESAPTNS